MSRYEILEDLPEDQRKQLLGQGSARYEILEDRPQAQGLTGDSSFLSKLGPNVLEGILRSQQGLINTPHNLAALLSSKLASHIPYAKNVAFPDVLQPPKNPTQADSIIQGLAQYAPAFALPEAGVAKGAGLGARALNSAIPQAAYGATQNTSPVEGGIEGGVAGALAPALEGGLNALRPSRFLRGKLSPEQLQRNVELSQGSKTNLGRVIQNPFLAKTYESFLPQIMGSGANEAMQDVAGKLTSHGHDIVNELGIGQGLGDTKEKLVEALKAAGREATQAKTGLYKDVNDLADKSRITIGRKEFKNSADTILKELKESPELEAEFSPDIKKDLQRYSDNPEGNTLEKTNIFRGKLGDKANELYRAGKTYEYNKVKQLQSALDRDISAELDMPGRGDLKSKYEAAQQNYKTNFAPFLDKDIVKFTREGGDADTIVNNFVRRGEADRSNLIAKLQQKMQPEDRKLLPSAYFSPAIQDGQLNPMKLRSLYGQLGENQRKTLLGHALNQKIKNFSDAISMNPESFHLMLNPMTGARTGYQLTGPNLAAAALGFSHMGIPGALAYNAAASGAGNIAQRLMSSPSVRESLVKAMIKNKTYGLPKYGQRAVGASLNSLLSPNEDQGQK